VEDRTVKTTWTSADTSTGQDFQGSSVTSEGARTACMTSVNKVVHRLISKIIVWLLKSYVHLGRPPTKWTLQLTNHSVSSRKSILFSLCCRRQCHRIESSFWLKGLSKTAAPAPVHDNNTEDGDRRVCRNVRRTWANLAAETPNLTPCIRQD
jgi:hypothetical protein